MSPDLVVGIFPVVKWCFTDLHESLLSWAAIQAALLKRDESAWRGVHLAAGLRTVSDSLFINFLYGAGLGVAL